MFRASKNYFDGMARRSAELGLDMRMWRYRRYDAVATAEGQLAVRRTINLRVTDHDTEATVWLQPPLADGRNRVRVRETGDIAHSYTMRDRIEGAVKDIANLHDEQIAARTLAEVTPGTDVAVLTDHEFALRCFGFDPSELPQVQHNDFLRRLGEPGNADF